MNIINNLKEFLKVKIVDLNIECAGSIVKIPQHSGVGDSIYKKKALDNPLSNALKHIFEDKNIKLWLISDPEFLPFNSSGDEFCDIEEEFNNSVIVDIERGLYLIDSSNIEKFIEYIYGDLTTIIGFQTSFKLSDNINIKKAWDIKSAVIYLECTDGLFWTVCDQRNQVV